MELPIVRAYQCDERDVDPHQLQGQLALGGDRIQRACPANQLGNLDLVETKGAGKCGIGQSKQAACSERTFGQRSWGIGWIGLHN